MLSPRSAIMGVLLALSLAPATPAGAEPFAAGDVLRATFGLRGIDVPQGTPDVFAVSVLVDTDAPFSHTVRLFDGEDLLDTYTSATHAPPANGFPFYVSAYFVSPSSVFAHEEPTVIDFRSLLDGTIDGAIEFTIEGGPITLAGTAAHGGSVELFLGRAVAPAEAYGVRVWTREFPEPVPEPASLVLLGSGLAALALRRCRRVKA